MKNRDLANLLARAAAVIVDPNSEDSADLKMLLEDLTTESDRIFAAPDLEAPAREALQFILALRDCEPHEALDLLTNNGGEDVESKLAAALGVDVSEDQDIVDWEKRQGWRE